ncbi:hypothetical protein H8N00_07625 [Streptomyces sp. AC563]|uniref:hypothetical protein n=1 Tax=Streptomyces buecherae TaxID=2763006 RepID=UPI00164DDC02|nr:hypothetical protein [Streptomyces buecherae]MBC3988757.1 hypothetical protein [Streptomyces buecherae]
MSTSSRHGSSQPRSRQAGEIIQEFGTVKQFPLDLSYEARMYSCQRLNRAVADTQLASQVIRTGEPQAWSLAEHLVDTPLVRT